MALSKIDVANMLTGATPVANGGTALTSGFVNGKDPRPNAKPLIINGNMDVAQRATSVTGVGDGDTGYHTLDRWRFSEGGDNSTVFTMSQDTDVPTGQGFANSLKMDVTTADASPGSSDAMFLQQRFEGQDLQLLKKGTSSAEKITVSFWVKSSKTGTHILEVQDSDNTRNCSQSYTVSSADTWEKKVVVFPADTTGALDDDNANSFEINWWLLAGTDFTSGTLATSFASRTNANRAVGQVNIGDNTSNNFYMTGCQMEIGEFSSTTLPPFQHESFGDNLARCQRYYYFHVSEDINGGSDVTISLSSQYNNSSVKGYITFPTRMRANPTLEQNTGSNMYRVYETNSNATFTTLTLSNETTEATGVFTAGSSVSVTAGSCGALQTMDSTAFVAFDAEL
jgi:hypothetical protein